MFTACNKPVDRSYNVWLCHNISITLVKAALLMGISSNYANKGLINMNDI